VSLNTHFSDIKRDVEVRSIMLVCLMYTPVVFEGSLMRVNEL